MANQAEKLFLQNIKNNKIEEVERFVRENPSVKKVFSDDKKSAPEIALESRRFEIYTILIDNGFTLDGEGEDVINEIMQSLPNDERKKLRELHDKYRTDCELGHLATLNEKSKLAHHHVSAEEQKEFHGLVAKAFSDLNEINEIRPILKCVALADALEITFDFSQKSVVHMDPTTHKKVRGICYHNRGSIYIGAQKLTSHEDRCEALGVIAHELCHFAMKLLYDNACKPYSDRSELIKHFESILSDAKSNQLDELCIKSVFKYPETQRHAELIVRVPQLQALYEKDDEKLEEVKAAYARLFEFYENTTLKDLEREYPLMEARRIVKQLNRKFMVLSKLENSEILLNDHALGSFSYTNEKAYSVFSNCPQLTMQMIYQQLSTQIGLGDKLIFMKLDKLNELDSFELLKKAFTKDQIEALIIDCSADDSECILRHFRNLSNELIKRIVLIHNDDFLKIPGSENVVVKHSWSQLTADSQENLLKTEINFQGKTMSLGKIAAADSDIYGHIELDSMISRCQEISIGKILNFDENKFHFRRKFLPPGSLRFRNTEFFSIEIDLQGLLTTVEKSKSVILSDEPGMGKSTEFKTIARKLKEKLPSHWIVFVELQHFHKAFQKDGKVSQRFDTRLEISSYFSDKILNVKDFEAKVFQHLFNKDRVVFVTDGFDEISPSFKEFNKRLFEKILEKSKNQLWVSTRPHLEQELTETLKGQTFKIKPLSLNERANFMRQIFQNKNINEAVINATLPKIEQFLIDLRECTFEPFGVTNPLILGMLVELFEDDPDASLAQGSYYTLYENFVRSMNRKSFDKGEDAKNDSIPSQNSSENMLKFYQNQAFKTVYNTDIRIIEKAVKSCFKNIASISSDRMARIGLMTSTNSNRFHFIHITFAEYLVANFFVNEVFKITGESKVSDSIRYLLKIVMTEPSLGLIRVFIDSAIESKTCQLEKVQSALSRNFSDQELKFYFRYSVNDGSIHIVEIISNHFTARSQSLSKLWLYEAEDKVFKNSLLNALASPKPIQFIEQLLRIARRDLDPHSYKQLFLDVGYRGLNFFFLAISNRRWLDDQGFFKFFLLNPLNPLSKEEKLQYLKAKTESGKKILVHAIACGNILELPNMLKIIKDNFGMDNVQTLLEDEFPPNAWEWLFLWVRPASVMKEFLDRMQEIFTEDETKEMFFIRRSQIHATSLDFAAVHASGEQIFEVFWNFFEKNYVDVNERNNFLLKNSAIFFHASSNYRKQVFNFVKEKYRNIFGERISELLSAENSNGENILFLAARKPKNYDTLEAVWVYMQEHLKPDVLKQLLLKRDKSGRLFGGNENLCKVPKAFEEFMLKHLNDDERKIFEIDYNPVFNMEQIIYFP